MRRAAAAAAGVTLGIWALVRWVLYDFPQLGDTRVYQHAVRMIDAGFVPYRDFDIEYPPLATGMFWLIERLPGEPTLAFSLVMAACLVATALATLVAGRRLGLSANRRVAATAIVALTPILLGTLVQTRYDLLLAALLGWTLVAALSDRFGWMWTLLALATAIKLVPVLLVPILAVWHVRRGGARRALRGVGAFAAGVGATIAPFALIAPDGTWRLFAYHLRRPLQMESLGSGILHALRVPVHQVHSFGSDNIDGSLPRLVASASTIALIGALLAIIIRFARRATTTDLDLLVRAFAATMLAAVVFGKVVSPQYLVWLLPATLLVRGRSGAVAAAALAVAMPMTQLIFPALYTHLVERSAPLPVGLLVIRNGLLIGILALLWPRGTAIDGSAGAAGPVLPQLAQPSGRTT